MVSHSHTLYQLLLSRLPPLLSPESIARLLRVVKSHPRFVHFLPRTYPVRMRLQTHPLRHLVTSGTLGRPSLSRYGTKVGMYLSDVWAWAYWAGHRIWGDHSLPTCIFGLPLWARVYFRINT